MKKTVVLVLVLSLLLSGCSFWMDGEYSSVVPHTEPNAQVNTSVTSVANYYQIQTSLVSMIKSGTESAVLTIKYDSVEQAQEDIEKIIESLLQKNPYAAYAVDKIRYEVGTNSGQTAFSVKISYLQNRIDVKKIQEVKDLGEVRKLIVQHLDDCAPGLVLYVEDWKQTDYAQIVADYALTYPQKVMEAPQVTVNMYPESGAKQIVELKFTYQTSRESLRTMQSHVALVFSSAELYVDRSDVPLEQCLQLYTFLMNRYSSYEIQTSITPAYSLLRHGVGDEKAFAMVYAAMCRRVGLDAQVVVGTRDAQPWIWNVVEIDGVFYHIDLLRCVSEEVFAAYPGQEMQGYVWDFSEYPIPEEINT